MNWIIGISLLIFFEVVADIFAKEYSLRGGWLFWVLGIVGYITANIFWLSSIKNGSGLARGAMIFSIGSALVAIILGIFFYKEHVSIYQIIGMILGVVALGFISYE